MDNPYSCANLFVLLCEKFDIVFAGTTGVNRVGWPKDVMTLTKSAQRGSSLVKYVAVNK